MKLSPEERQRRRDAAKARWADPEFRAKMKGRVGRPKKTPFWKAKVIETNLRPIREYVENGIKITVCPPAGAHQMFFEPTARCSASQSRGFATQEMEEKELSHEDAKLQAMSRAVIVQVIMDMRSKSKKAEAIKAKRDAEIYIGSKDFVDVCLNANLSPEYVLRKIEERRSVNWNWRKKSGDGWRVQKRKQEEKLNEEVLKDIGAVADVAANMVETRIWVKDSSTETGFDVRSL